MALSRTTHKGSTRQTGRGSWSVDTAITMLKFKVGGPTADMGAFFLWLRQIVSNKTRQVEVSVVSSNFTRFSSKSRKLISEYTENLSFENALSGSNAKTRAHTFPAISIHHIPHARIKYNPRFSGIFVENRCLIPVRLEPRPWEFRGGVSRDFSGRIAWQTAHFIATKKALRPTRLSKAIFIGTRAPHNYYHWMINGLPQLFIADTVARVPKDWPVIVPEPVLANPNLLAALHVISQGRTIVPLDTDCELEVEDLAVVDPPPVYDTPLSIDLAHRIPLGMNDGLMRKYRSALLAANPQGVSPHEVGRYIYLTRAHGDPRTPNNAQLEQVARDLGFSLVRAEQYNFFDQMAIFQNAQVIIGASGAAFTNLIFCRKGTLALIWKPKTLARENFFANAASVSGAKLFSLETDGHHSGPAKSASWELSPARLGRAVNTLLSKTL